MRIIHKKLFLFSLAGLVSFSTLSLSSWSESAWAESQSDAPSYLNVKNKTYKSVMYGIEQKKIFSTPAKAAGNLLQQSFTCASTAAATIVIGVAEATPGFAFIPISFSSQNNFSVSQAVRSLAGIFTPAVDGIVTVVDYLKGLEIDDGKDDFYNQPMQITREFGTSTKMIAQHLSPICANVKAVAAGTYKALTEKNFAPPPEEQPPINSSVKQAGLGG